MSGEKILVIDDDLNILEVIRMRLKAWGYYVIVARNGEEAKSALSATSFNLVIIDLRLSEENGIELMEGIIRYHPNIPVIILTAHGSIESAVEAMRKGAYSYITKPFHNEDLSLHIKNALEKHYLTKEIEHLRSQLDEQHKFKHIIGKDKRMQEILDRVSMIAKTDCIVSVYGESGTGKELIARAIHYNSDRLKYPFVAINCGTVPEETLEEELFGHIRGHKDAHEKKEGLFIQADGGTIFLDEIGTISSSLQTKLLEVLQEGVIKPVGGTKSMKTNVRVIVASNTDMQKAVNDGTFRKDLFYKIHVVPIYIPPLRERRDDIPLLATYFLTGFCKVLKKDIIGFTPAAIQRMILYDWPGNVRELQNKIEHAIITTNKNIIATEDIFTSANILKNTFNSYKDAKERFEREYIENLLKISKGNISTASKMAKRYRADIYKLIKKYNLNPENYKNGLTKANTGRMWT
ncbi:MAG: sigma-54-dependent Fis family transcriptional regulator [Candidatus Brocadia sp. AMX2]|uniref:Sigma 54 response regulator n=1 Tax=Candidatus Brocadia sinica JPN1 TaxID=1197129 RepID=A0ABQ0JZ77_9BACT|nr:MULTISPECIES: sigma-54 dependent transcriptional regulator [Brocadia]MBC6931217.1 sigma-54-dependent Fis family transcriptional regulator [Candidatus Brocadia sp.]MBL1168612.1 sigma-54-dependent Fis family transcriptional regulator [Candidatus Brocadia sp. AMX1]MCK6467268.1 sigma-54 dependent transcriptional regulator [Candidatus Brocadia sinica]NOG40150.1 sigma-54-dependent Fis family transcriptional regulator [Planctomycetota bacterium]KAA0246081.1 MAG: sigma-54-dependent Fis family trans